MTPEEFSAYEDAVRVEAARQWQGMNRHAPEHLVMGAVQLIGSYPDTTVVLNWRDDLRGGLRYSSHALWHRSDFRGIDGRGLAGPEHVALLITTLASDDAAKNTGIKPTSNDPSA